MGGKTDMNTNLYANFPSDFSENHVRKMNCCVKLRMNYFNHQERNQNFPESYILKIVACKTLGASADTIKYTRDLLVYRSSFHGLI